MKLNGQALFAGVIILIFGSLSLMALTLSSQAMLLPLIIGVPGVLLCMIAVLRELRSGFARPEIDNPLSRREVGAMMWNAGVWLSALLFGFMVGAPLVTAGYFAAGLKKGVLCSVAGGFTCFLITWGLFDRLLDIQRFEGLLLR
jgi:hypothetical protein